MALSPEPALRRVGQPVTHLLYLHGFRSGPGSTKARQMAAWMAQHRPDVVWACPQLPPSPADAMALVRSLTEPWPAPGRAVVGSSLGGFYATVLAEALGCRAVLINPAVDPARDLASWIGEVGHWHTPERFRFEAAHVEELRTMAPAAITRPRRYLALIAKGDEVLSWREMAARYRGANKLLLDGGDHALGSFEDHLPLVARFLGWAGRPSRPARHSTRR